MIKKVFLIHHTHYDIGFTDLPEEVIRKQLLYLDRAVRFCEKDAGFHWTIESGSLLRNYLEARPPQMVERILKFLRNGQLEVAAFDMQMLTETASFAELYANVSRIVELGKKYNFPVKCAILDDIGGWAGELPKIMNLAGLRYLVAGVGACQAELPWADLPHLFYLKSRSGGRIMVWNLGIDRNESSDDSQNPFAVYGLGGAYLGYRGFEEYLGRKDGGATLYLKNESAENHASVKELFGLLLKRLESENYPYEEILLQYGGDNRCPNGDIAELVRCLNASGDFPEIVLTTPGCAMQYLEEKYQKDIPELEGIISDPWNIRMNGVPSVLKKFRKAQRKYETLRLTGVENKELFESLMLLADHTFGLNLWGWQEIAENSREDIADPFFDRARRSWEIKNFYSENALFQAEKSERIKLGSALQTDENTITVFNSAPHIVSGTAELYLGSYSPQITALRDSRGNAVSFQKINHNRYMIYVENVPALGSVRLEADFDREYPWKYDFMQEVVPEKIENDFYSCTLEVDGSIKSVALSDGKCISDGIFGKFQYEKFFDIDVVNEHCNLKSSIDRKQFSLEKTEGHLIADGELFSEVRHSGFCENTGVNIFYRFWKKFPRIDIAIRINKPETPEKSCMRMIFPFSGGQGAFCYDQNVGIAVPEKLLPGSVREVFFCSRYAALQTEEFNVVMCCPDAPVVEFGSARLADWKKDFPYTPDRNCICALIGNNICNTDAPAWYPLRDRFEYSIFLNEGEFSPVAAQKYWESSNNLNAFFGFEEIESICDGLPDEIRLHSNEKGELFVENLLKKECSFSFKLRDKKYTGTLAPLAIEKIH